MSPDRFSSPSAAAKRLGVSPKALRHYERHGLLEPIRTAAGWRAYGAAEMERAAEIVALRSLGLSLAAIARVLGGDRTGLAAALAAHQSSLEHRIRELADTTQRVRTLRADLEQGKAPKLGELLRLTHPASEARASFSLPWPWGGEEFELRDVRTLNYIVGPLGSGKTRLADAIARHLPDTTLVGLERLAEGRTAAAQCRGTDPAWRARVDRALTWLAEDGAVTSPALVVLVVALECEVIENLVVDMIEQDLDHATQQALMNYLRRHGRRQRAIFMLTRSSAILDLSAVGPDESIILCPANHSPPTLVAPYPGSPGYEAVATCLALPDVRARTAGVRAVRVSENGALATHR